MKRVKQFNNEFKTLYLVTTPIGNLSDITYRAIDTLKSVDKIYCEDTRITVKLLNHYEIKKPLEAYHDHNKNIVTKKILEELKHKDIALVSDAGYPLLSDPGYLLVSEARKLDINVVSIGGVSAVLNGLVISGITPYPFTFIGFLDSKKNKREKQLLEIKERSETLVFYESVHRINAFLNSVYDVLEDRDICLVRELTKKHEEVIYGKVSEIKDIEGLKGEFVVVVSGYKKSFHNKEDMLSLYNGYLDSGLSKKDAIKRTAKDLNVKKNDVYQKVIESEEL